MNYLPRIVFSVCVLQLGNYGPNFWLVLVSVRFKINPNWVGLEQKL